MYNRTLELTIIFTFLHQKNYEDLHKPNIYTNTQLYGQIYYLQVK